MAKPFKALRNSRLGLDDQIMFGTKHQGKSVSLVIEHDPSYIDWLMKNTDIQFYESVYEKMDEILPEIKPFKVPYDMTYQYFMDEDIPF